jgi:ribosomal protein L7/L12
MKYDSDLIETIYILQKNNPALAARMWDRLTAPVAPATPVVAPTKSGDVEAGYQLIVPEAVVLYLQRNHSSYNKVSAIKALREKTGWGLKDAKDAVDFMIYKSILK